MPNDVRDSGKSGSRLAACAAVTGGALALVALAGWRFDQGILRSLLPESVPMNPATAVGLLCAAAALWLQRNPARSSVTVRMLALATLALGLWKLVAIVTGPDAGIDRFLFPEKIEATAGLPNRMAPNTAVCLALLGSSLFLISQRRRAALAQALALASGSIAFFAFLGHLYGLADLYRIAAYIPMAFNTSIALTALSFGVVAVRPRDGVARVVTASGAGGYLARRLLPAAIALPAILGALRLWGEHSGFYARETGTLLFVVSSILLMSGLVWWTARAIDRMDRERRAAVARIRDLYDRAPCGYHSLDSDGRFVEVNQTELAWLGYAREEIIGTRFVDVITPESRERFYDNFPRFKETGEVHDLEFDLVRKDGATSPVLLSAAAIYDEAGQYVMSRTTMFDITARRNLEKALRESSLFFESIFETLPHMVFLKDAADLRFVKLNRAGEGLLGYRREELVGKNDYDFFPPEQAEFFVSKDRQVLAQREVVDVPEEPIRTADGRTRILHTRKVPILGSDGAPRFLLGISEDVTERKRAEEARAHLAAIVDSSDDAILSKALDGTILTWNTGAERLYGYTAEEMVGTHVSRLTPSDRADELPRILERAGKGESIDHFETIRVRKDGSEVTVLLTISPIRDRGGRVVATSTIAHDVTERKRAEERIQLLNKELEAFSYSVSHDLRAPLRAIVGFSQALLEDHAPGLDETGRRLLDRIVGAGQRMGALIDDLLAFSRLSRAELRRQSVDLTRMIREIERVLREADPTRDVDIVVAEGLRGEGDPQLVRAALENLIGNAWKFTRGREGARVELGATAENGRPGAFFVRDNGAGFDMRYADKLFAPFQRLHAASEFEGTGIGLATVQRIIERHGGRIWAEGAVGDGATFYFTLGER